MEVYCQLQISIVLSYITNQQFNNLRLSIDKIATKLNALNRSIIIRSSPETKDNKPG